MKKLFMLALALVLCLGAFAACGGENPAPGPDGETSQAVLKSQPTMPKWEVGDLKLSSADGYLAYAGAVIEFTDSEGVKTSHPVPAGLMNGSITVSYPGQNMGFAGDIYGQFTIKIDGTVYAVDGMVTIQMVNPGQC